MPKSEQTKVREIEAARFALAPTTKTSAKSLRRMQRRKFLEHSEPMLDELFTSIRAGLAVGDTKIIELAAQMHGYVTSGKGPTFVANMTQNNSNKAEATSTYEKSFDALVRRLDSRDAADSPVIDLEPSQDLDD